ncbi:hypothetical protein [Phascolarctobacterium sp.]|uniref:hypothetical protein n=1 Tax=Phascolarctobacterium sp. TaxID=2049039 RepID=UPI0026DDB6BC|nr:hypothetical protein [Phascolarctobacterium sp.]
MPMATDLFPFEVALLPIAIELLPSAVGEPLPLPVAITVWPPSSFTTPANANPLAKPVAKSKPKVTESAKPFKPAQALVPPCYVYGSFESTASVAY